MTDLIPSAEWPLERLLKRRQDIYRIRHEFKYMKAAMEAHKPGEWQACMDTLAMDLRGMNKLIKAARQTGK